MGKAIVEITHNDHCQTCRGEGSIPNPLSRPKQWRRIERQAFKLVSNRPNIQAHPRAWARLGKLRDLARRYQSIRPCPHCAKRRRPTAEEAAKRLGIEPWHPHVNALRALERQGLLSWSWPPDCAALYTLEHIVPEVLKV